MRVIIVLVWVLMHFALGKGAKDDCPAGSEKDGQHLFYPKIKPYPHLHCNKDFTVYSWNDKDHVDLVRGDKPYCANMDKVLSMLKDNDPCKQPIAVMKVDYDCK